MTERYYAGPVRFAIGDQLSLSPEESHHLLKVMRAQPGATFQIFGDKVAGTAVLRQRSGAQAIVQIEDMLPAYEPPTVQMTFAIPWIKGGKTENVVQKLTELGVETIIIYSAAREVARGDEGKLERLERVALDACKQSERSEVPRLRTAASLEAAVTSTELPPPQRIILYERERNKPFDVMLREGLEAAAERHVFVGTGPEGGFAPEEIQGCRELAVTAGFGSRILRAETAPVAAAAAILALTANL